MNATDGSVGYADIATARGASPSFAITPETNDNDKYWTQLHDGGPGNGVFREPTADPNGFRAEGTKGANCAGAEFTNEGNPLPSSLGDWAKVSGVNSPGAFPTCTLTYGLMFDDDADVWGGGATEEALARTVKDYWENAVLPSTQSALTSGTTAHCRTRSSRSPRRRCRNRLGKGPRRRRRRRRNPTPERRGQTRW